MAKRSLESIEAEIYSLKSRKSEINGAMKLLNEEVQKRSKMGMDTTEYKEQLNKFDKEIAEIIKKLPELNTELYEEKRHQAAEMKKERLREYLEARFEYYDNALKKLKGKKGKVMGFMQPIDHLEAQIGQYNREER